MNNSRLLLNTSLGRSQRGFSLIELLVVLLIIGLGFGLASVNVGDNTDQQLGINAKQFANRTSLIAEQAVLSNEQWGVDFYRQLTEQGDQYGYRWLMRNDEGVWQLATVTKGEVDYILPLGMGMRLELLESNEEFEILAKREIKTKASTVLKKQTLAEQLGSDASTEEELIQPALWLLSSGEMSPFRLTLYDNQSVDEGGSEASVTVVGDELGRIIVEKLPNENDL